MNVLLQKFKNRTATLPRGRRRHEHIWTEQNLYPAKSWCCTYHTTQN